METIWKIPGDVEQLVTYRLDLRTNRTTVTVNAAEVAGESVSRAVTKYSFMAGGVPAILWVSPGFPFPRASLRVGAHDVAPSTELSPWIGRLSKACFAIPIITMGGLIPALLGVGAGAAVLKVGSRKDLSDRQRVRLCFAITLSAWAITAGVVALSSAVFE